MQKKEDGIGTTRGSNLSQSKIFIVDCFNFIVPLCYRRHWVTSIKVLDLVLELVLVLVLICTP